MRHTKIGLVTAVVIAVAFTDNAAAARKTSPGPLGAAAEIVSFVASHTVEGWADNAIPLSVMEQDMVAGRSLRVGCGVQANLAVRALLRAGIPARPVAVVSTLLPKQESGHTLLEVWLNGRWQVFDPTFNAKPVLPNGKGLSIEDLIARVVTHRPIWFVPLAHDRAVDWTDYPAGYNEALTRRQLAHGAIGFYRDIFHGGVPLIWSAQYGLVYTSSSPAIEQQLTAEFAGEYTWLDQDAYVAATESGTDYDPYTPLTWG